MDIIWDEHGTPTITAEDELGHVSYLRSQAMTAQRTTLAR